MAPRRRPGPAKGTPAPPSKPRVPERLREWTPRARWDAYEAALKRAMNALVYTHQADLRADIANVLNENAGMGDKLFPVVRRRGIKL